MGSLTMPKLNKRSATLKRKIFRVVVNLIGNALRSSSSRSLAQGVLAFSRPLRKFHLVRRWVDEAQIDNPLARERELPEIDLVLAVASKDFRTARLAVSECRTNSMNKIRRTLIVVADENKEKAGEVFGNQSVAIVSESDFLPHNLIDSIENNHPPGRKGWITQQVIGLLAARQSDAAGVLILDADTVFIRPIAFLGSEGKQLLQFSHEYVSQYEEHAEKVWGRRLRHKQLSYVTHYQLMQPSVVREMFPQPEDLGNWIANGDMNLQSPIADYHSYGRFLVDRYPNAFTIGRWGNKSVEWDTASRMQSGDPLEALRIRYASTYSISFHSYL